MERELNILLVEDESQNAQLICRSLDDVPDTTINWICTAQLREGLDRLKQNGVDLVLMDLAIEKSGDLQAFHQLRRQAPDVPIIVLAEAAERDLALEAIQQGARDYVLKDRYEIRQLLHSFNNTLARELARTRLRQSEDKFKILFENSPDAIFVEDTQGRVLDVNQSACELHGMAREELIGKSVFELVPPGTHELVRKDFERLLNKELDVLEGSSYSHQHGEIPVEIRAARILYEGQDALVLHVRDVHLRKIQERKIRELNRDLEKRVQERTCELEQINLELERANSQLRELDRMKSTFMNIASHELRTPLAAVTGMLNIIQLKMPDNAKSLSNAIRVAVNGAERLSRIVERTLKITSAESYADARGMIKKPVVPQALLKQVTEKVQPFLVLRGQHLVIDIDEEIPSIPMQQELIEDALQNLLMNAIKFTEDEGYICISVRQLDERQAIFRVSDTGIGVSEEDRPHVFKEFFASFDVMHHSSGTYEFETRGIGLGLAFVKKFIEMHKGQVGFETIKDIGSMFYFTLPLTDPPQPE